MLGLHCNTVWRAMFHALNPLSDSLLADSCPPFTNSLLEKLCILHFPFRQPECSSRQLKISLFSENGLCISPLLFKPLMPSCGHTHTPPPPSSSSSSPSPSQFSSWGCLMSLQCVSPNGSFIVTAAGNGSWEAVDGSSLLLPPLANALFYQPRDERTAAPRPSVWHAGCCYANRLSESSFCCWNIQKHPLQCKHKLSRRQNLSSEAPREQTHMCMINMHAIFSILVTFVCLFSCFCTERVILISACLSSVSR